MMKWYGKSLLLRRGINLSIHPTFRCNQKCRYCFMDMPEHQRPKCAESTFDEWKDFVREFTKTHKVKEVSICGGEPTLMPYISELTNWLLSEGYHVMIFSNLFRADKLQSVKKSYRFKIQATFHHCDDPHRFFRQFQLLSSRHRVDVDEIADGVPQRFLFSKVKPQFGEQYLHSNGARIRPDRTIFTNCWDMYATTTVQSPESNVK